MAVDRYTKLVLTVIAVCLVWLSFGGSPSTPVSAQQNGDRIFLAGWVDENGMIRKLPAVPFIDETPERQRDAPLGSQLKRSTAPLPTAEASK